MFLSTTNNLRSLALSLLGDVQLSIHRYMWAVCKWRGTSLPSAGDQEELQQQKQKWPQTCGSLFDFETEVWCHNMRTWNTCWIWEFVAPDEVIGEQAPPLKPWRCCSYVCILGQQKNVLIQKVLKLSCLLVQSAPAEQQEDPRYANLRYCTIIRPARPHRRKEKEEENVYVECTRVNASAANKWVCYNLSLPHKVYSHSFNAI